MSLAHVLIAISFVQMIHDSSQPIDFDIAMCCCDNLSVMAGKGKRENLPLQCDKPLMSSLFLFRGPVCAFLQFKFWQGRECPSMSKTSFVRTFHVNSSFGMPMGAMFS